MRATRAALAHTRERFRCVFEHAAVGMALLGLDGRWLQVNEALADIVGYAPSELLHLTFRDITGTVHSWTHGFFLHNDDGLPVRDATRVASREWQRYEASLFSLVPRPWRIIRVEVVASGWDYASSVNSIHLWAD